MSQAGGAARGGRGRLLCGRVTPAVLPSKRRQQLRQHLLRSRSKPVLRPGNRGGLTGV